MNTDTRIEELKSILASGDLTIEQLTKVLEALEKEEGNINEN